MTDTLAKDINYLILQITDSKELRAVWNAVVHQDKYLQRKAKLQFAVGSMVKFNDKNGNTVTGQVTKINPKNVVVRVESTRTNWRVTPTLLSAA
jgi:ribosomal protein L35AE/L33A